MSEKKFIVEPGDQINISIPRKQPSPGDEISSRRVSPPRGMIRARRADDYLPRRLQNETYLNFYDLGHIKNPTSGRFEDLPYYFYPSPDSNFTDAPDGGDLNALLFAVPFADWKTRFNKLTKTTGEKYQLDVYAGVYPFTLAAGEAAWTDNGLKLTAEQIASANTYGLAIQSKATATNKGVFQSVQILNDSILKITAAPVYASPSVNLTISGKMDIFLVPQMMSSFGFSEYSTATGARPFHRAILNFIYSTYRRSLFLDETDPYYNHDFGGGTLGSNRYTDNSDRGDSTLAAYDQAILVSNFSKTIPGARVYTGTASAEGDFDNNSGTLADYPLDLVTYPPSPPSGDLPDSPYVETFYTPLGDYNPATLEPFLLAVVMKGGSIFYIWGRQF